jgi:Ca2+-binding EF-hand superfamily protein
LLLKISENLKNFQETSVFQAGVMTYIITETEQHQDLDNLKEVFLTFDQNSDGKLK